MRIKIIIFAALLVLVFLGLWLMTDSRNSGKVSINLVVAPSVATITVDGEPVNGGDVKLTKGKHVFVANFRDFTPDKKTVDVVGGETVTLSPLPESEDALQYLIDNPDIQEEREQAAAQLVDEAGEASPEEYPFLSDLPIETETYSIYSGAPERSKVKSNGSVALHVVAETPAGRSQALNRIRDDLGVDPSSIEIVFVALPNIFIEGTN